MRVLFDRLNSTTKDLAFSPPAPPCTCLGDRFSDTLGICYESWGVLRSSYLRCTYIDSNLAQFLYENDSIMLLAVCSVPRATIWRPSHSKLNCGSNVSVLNNDPCVCFITRLKYKIFNAQIGPKKASTNGLAQGCFLCLASTRAEKHNQHSRVSCSRA